MLPINGLRLSFSAVTLSTALVLMSVFFAERVVAASIEDSLAAGLERSNAVAAARQAFVEARQTIGQATGANDLTGNFVLRGSETQIDSGASIGGFVSDTSLFGSVTLSKRIYDSGEASTRRKIAELDIMKARADYQLTEQNVIFDVVSAHLGVLSAQKAFEIRNANERRLNAHTEAARIRLEAGTSTPTRLAEAEARLARAQSDKIVAEAKLQTAFETYQSLTGLDGVSLKGFDRPADLPATIADAETQAGVSHPSVIIADLQEKISGFEFKLLKQSVLPKIDFNLSATKTDRAGTSSDKDEVTTKLQLSAPFLVTEATRSASRSRQANLAKVQLNAAESRRVIRLAARRIFRNFKASAAQLQAVELELKAANLVAEGTASEVEFGLKTLLDQLDAEQNLSDVELRFVQAQQDQILNGYDVMRTIGQLNVSSFKFATTMPLLDSISDPPSRYPYPIPLMVK